MDKTRAAVILRRYYIRQLIRVAHHQFGEGLSPDKVGRLLTRLHEVVIETALQYTLGRMVQRRGMPQRPDGTTPEFAVIALGNLGGQEMAYNSPSKLVFLYDSIDHKNTWHLDFYRTLVEDMVTLLRGDQSSALSIDVDLREGPRHEVGVHICSYREAVRIYETSGRTWQRLSFVKARTVAGSKSLGDAFSKRLEPWVFGRFLNRIELAEIQTLRKKLEKRAEAAIESGIDIARAPGGRADIELTVQFLQVLHGGDVPEVRCQNTNDAIVALERAGCLTHQESTLLSENYARLCRLLHQLAVTFDFRDTRVPEEADALERLSWQLGIRVDERKGDPEKFASMLDDTFQKNRKVINHLMLDAPADDSVCRRSRVVARSRP